MANDSMTPIMCPLTYNGKRQTGDPATQPVNGAQCEDPLGRIWRDVDPTYGNRAFKFVNLASTATGATVAAGSVVYYEDSDDLNLTVTDDISDVTGGRNRPAGVLYTTVTAGNNCWIQTEGYYAGVLANGDTFAAGEKVIPDSSDGLCAHVAIGTAPPYPCLGTAKDVSSGTPLKVPVYLHVGRETI